MTTKQPNIEFFKDNFHVKATIGTFIEAVYVEEINVFDKQTGQNITWELNQEIRGELTFLAVVYYKDLK